jgi:hypothetical protein
MGKPIAWYDPSNGMVSTDQDSPLFTPLGQVWGLYLKEEANEFNPDWDTQAVLVEEIQRMAKRIEELEAKDEPYALEASIFSNDRVKIDPVTGNVSIGTPQRTWVGLTDEDEIDWDGGDLKSLIKAIEKALKERNT